MNWVARLFTRRRDAEETSAEIQAHIAERADELVERGMSRDNAAAQARREFGNVTVVEEDVRGVWRWPRVEDFVADARFAFRTLRKSPGFTAIVILTLALGIGANTAIFSVVYAVLLRPLPFRDASQLVVLRETTPKVGAVGVSYPNFVDWRAQSRTFSQMVDVTQVGFNLSGVGVSQPVSVMGYAVSPAYLSTLGVSPILGRDFSASEETPGTAPVVILSHALWQSHFGGDPGAIGKSIALDGRGFTVVGVLPADYRPMEQTDLLEPIGVWLGDYPDGHDRGDRGDSVVIGRIASDATFAQATGEMQGIAARIAEQYPATNDKYGVALKTMRDQFAGNARPAVLVLFGAVLFVLLIACANVANLLLVRSSSRGREIALRYAFGASRGRIARQLLTESFILALFGGVLGVALAIGGIHAISRYVPPEMLSGSAIELNGVVLLFAVAVVLLAAFIFGMAPVLQASKPDLQTELKENAKTASAGPAQNKMLGAFGVAEIALAVVLLAGTGLMIKTLYRLMAVDPGFRTDRVLTATLDLSPRQYPNDAAKINFAQRVLDGVRAIPGVEVAAVGTDPPLLDAHSRSDITVEGMAALKPGEYPHPDWHSISPGYVETLRIPLVRGRAFTDSDNESAAPVCIINAMLAREYFANTDPVGKRIAGGRHAGGVGSNSEQPRWMTVVGVVGDTKMYGLANPARLEIYFPFRQNPSGEMNVLLRSANDPASLTSSLRAVVAGVDKDEPISEISTMDELVRRDVATQRMTLVMLGLFSATALILAAIGIYGVISYSVARRTHELGIRTALGAQSTDLLRMVLGQGMALAVAGVAAGLAASLALARLMASLLFAVHSYDPATFISVAALILAVAAAACYIPARRAMRVDPIAALRSE
jgi:putative ABC transport system permease protein